MRDAQAAAEAAKAGLKKRRGRPSKNALAAAAAGMLTVLAPLPKGTLMYHPRYDPNDAETAPPATVGAKRNPPARRPGRPPRKKVPAVEDVEYFEPAPTTGPEYNDNQFDPNGNYQNNTDTNARGSIGGEEAMLLDGFWTAVTAGAPPPTSGGNGGALDNAERRVSGAVVPTGRRNRPTRARIPSRRRTSFSMSSEDEGSDEEDEEERYHDEDEDFVVKGKQQRYQQQQRQQIWRPQSHAEDDHISDHAAPAPAPAAGAQEGSDFEGEDDTDNEDVGFDREEDDEEYVPQGGRRSSLHARRSAGAPRGDIDNNDEGMAHGGQQEEEEEDEEEYMIGGIRTLPINQQHPGAMSPGPFNPSPAKQMQQQQQQDTTAAPAAAAGTAAAAPTATANHQQQQYFEEPALLLGSSRAERRVSLGDVPLSPAVFSPALTPPWSRKKRHNHARLAAFGPSVPTTGGAIGANNATAQQGTPRRPHHPSSTTAAAAALQAGAPLASPGILHLLNSPESFHHQRRSPGGDGGHDHDDDTGVGNHHHSHHHHHRNGSAEDDFFPGVFPESPALPQFAGLITPEWARAAAAASAAAEDAEVRRLSIASVARRLDVDSVAVAIAANGGIGSGDSPPQAGSLSVSLSLSAGGIPPAAQGAAAGLPSGRHAAAAAGGATAITPAEAAAIVAAPGIEHAFFSPVEQQAALATGAMTQAPSSAPYPTTTTAVPSSGSHGRTFLAAALQRTVGSGLMPAPGTFFPNSTTATAPGAATGELATPMAIEDLLLTPLGVHIANGAGDSNVPQGALKSTQTAAPAGVVVPMVMETLPAVIGADGVIPADIAAVLQQAGLVSLPISQYNRVVLQNTTLTARKDAPPVAAAAAAGVATDDGAAPLSSSDVRMKLQALLEQV
jgi:hypothetical protein